MGFTMMLAGRGALAAVQPTACAAAAAAFCPTYSRPTRSYHQSSGRRRQAPWMQQEGGGGEVVERPVLNGFLALHKPEGWTSNDVVGKVGDHVQAR